MRVEIHEPSGPLNPLSGLHCGQMLERARHMDWAPKIVGAEQGERK